MTMSDQRDRLMPTSKKVCITCYVEKHIGHFYPQRRVCKSCVYASRDLSSELGAARRYRKKNAKALNNRACDKARGFATWFDSLKIGPCSDCGVVHQPYVMDWDHVRGTKKYNLSYLRRRWSCKSTKRQILKEIAKCDLVCSNCHRERTHQRTQEARPS